MKLKSVSLVVAATVAGLGMTGCSQAEQPKPQAMAKPAQKHKYQVEFTGIHAPVTDMEKRVNNASPFVTVNGQTYPLTYDVIARSGDKFKSGVFGRIYNKKGEPIMSGGQPWDSVDMDHTTLLPRIDKSGNQRLFSVTQFESAPGAFYMTELYQDKSSGKLIAVDTQHIDDSHVNGSWVMCAGMRTPWLTHLSSEEYEPNARLVEEGKGSKAYKWDQMTRYFDDPKEANPYDYGWTPEIDVQWNKKAAKFEPKMVKHYAMGRFAHELAYVMPDNKTVYLSDDGTNVGLFMFVADEAGDLSAGQLYAAKWIQKSAKNGGEADLKWIALGWASNDVIKESLDAKVKFSDMFKSAKPAADGSCPKGFKSVNTTAGLECLKLNQDMHMEASRLETRRYAAMVGATTEFRKEEGITYDAQSNRLFVVMSEVARGMEDNGKNGKSTDKYDKGGHNDIKLPFNKCGTVYALDIAEIEKDDKGFMNWVPAWDDKNNGKKQKPSLKKVTEIKSHYVAKNMKGLVSGIMDKNENTPYAGANKCNIDSLANPDNATMIEKSNILIIGEDTGSGHQNDAVWAYDLDKNKLTRIFTTPYGSETTSPYWYKDINGHGYMTVVTQHPYGEGDAIYSPKSKNANYIKNLMKGSNDSKGFVGYIYGFPSMR